MLGCTPQAYKACACPASRLKKESGISNRDINGFMDGRAYMPEARSWGDTPPCAAHGRQDIVAVFAGGWGGITSYRGIDIRWAH